MKKHVLFLPKWYPNKIVLLSGGFVEKQARSLGSVVDVSVIYVRGVDRKEDVAMESTVEEGIRVVRVYFKKYSGIFRLFNIVRYNNAQRHGLAEIVKSKGLPDLVHVHVLGRNAGLALRLKKRQNIPFLVSEHWSGYIRNSLNTIQKWMYPVLAKRAHGISAVSEYLAECMRRYGIANTIRIVPNVVDTKVFSINAESTEQERKYILTICDLRDEVKNVSGMIRAFSKLRERFQDIEFYIVGEGPDKQKLLDLIQSLNLSSGVKFLGEFKEAVKLAGVIRGAVFVTSFSRFETFGITIAESLSCGVPVVVSNIPAFREFVDSGKGILVQSGNETALLKGWEEMLLRKSGFKATALNSEIEKHYSAVAIRQNLFDWYTKTLLPE